VEPGTPSLPKSAPPSSGGTSTPPPTGWSAPVLAGVEIELARFVGPVAKVLVRRAARDNKQIDALVGALLESIDRPEDRQAFARAVTGRSIAPARAMATVDGMTPLPLGTSPGPALTPAELEHATKLLTRYIGPIARVVAKRAAAEGVSRRDFLNQVAQSLENDAQRERFLREAAVPVG